MCVPILNASAVPRRTLLEAGLPVEELYEFALREGNSKKPIYEIHKWWARRLGHVFRLLLLSATTPAVRRAHSHGAMSELLKKFYEQNDLKDLVVLDPFMGGGTSVVESLKCGASAIGADIDPVAWFVTKKEVEPFDEERVKQGMVEVAAQVEEHLRSLYGVKDRSGRAGEIINAFWVHRIWCGRCRHAFDGHPHFRLAYDRGRNTQDVFCRACGTITQVSLEDTTFDCGKCGTATEIEAGPVSRGLYTCPACAHTDTLISRVRPGKPIPKRMFALEYTRESRGAPVGRHFRKATAGDVAQYRRAASLLDTPRDTPLPFPRATIFTENRTDARPVNYGYARYEQLFNRRQLYTLAKIHEAILGLEDSHAQEYLLLAFSDCLASNNLLVSYAFGYRKLTPLFGIHAYNVVQRPVEGNAWGNPHFGRGSFTRCVAKMIEGKRYARDPYEYRYSGSGRPERIYTGERITTPVVRTQEGWDRGEGRAFIIHGSATDLSMIADQTVDLVLTDPPFYNNLPYSELSDFYYQWLRPYLSRYNVSGAATTPVGESLFVRRHTPSEHAKYVDGLTQVFKECARVLKPTGLLAFTFQHRDARAWHALAVALTEANFRVTGLSPVRAEGKSGFHTYEGTPKWDSVICCRYRAEPIDRRYEQTSAAERVIALEGKWTARFTAAGIQWGVADRASFALSAALREGVNARLDRTELGALLTMVNRRYPQRGVRREVGQPARAAEHIARTESPLTIPAT